MMREKGMERFFPKLHYLHDLFDQLVRHFSNFLTMLFIVSVVLWWCA